MDEEESHWHNWNQSHPMSPQWDGSLCLGRQGPRDMYTMTWGFEKAKDCKTKISFPPHKSPLSI
jgi:hypothetical protein